MILCLILIKNIVGYRPDRRETKNSGIVHEDIKSSESVLGCCEKAVTEETLATSA
jgi:hypothetical protein